MNFQILLKTTASKANKCKPEASLEAHYLRLGTLNDEKKWMERYTKTAQSILSIAILLRKT
nr:MAG TPA: hypothetical protein [Caudoviricetes sp.]